MTQGNRSVGVLLLALFAAAASAGEVVRESPRDNALTIVFEQAEFLRSGDASPPPPASVWTQVTLPHDWRLLPNGKRPDVGWYRISFELERVPSVGTALYLRNLRSDSLELFVNGARLAGSREFNPPRSAQDYNFPFYVFIPTAMLRTGANVLHIRMRGSSVIRSK